MNSQSTTMNDTLADTLRIIWTITLKDIVDGFRNKTIVTIILTITFLMLFYKLLPALTGDDSPPRLAVYAAGDSELLSALEESATVDLRQFPSQQRLEHYLGGAGSATLALTLPDDFDRLLQSNQQIELTGFVEHWVTPSDLSEMQALFERELSDLAGRPVHITIEQGRVYAQEDGYAAFTLSLAMVVLISMFGLSLTPMLMWEEKQTRTLDSLLVSPATGGQIVISKAATSLLYCLIGAALTLALNRAFILQWSVAVMAVAVGSLFTIALGLLLGTLLETKQQISTVTFILYQPLLLPVVAAMFTDLLPDTLLRILNLIPTVALGKLFRTLPLGEVGFSQVGPELAYITGCALLTLAAVAWLVRRTDLK